MEKKTQRKKADKITTKKWIKETLKRYGKLVFEEPWICLFLTQDQLEEENET